MATDPYSPGGYVAPAGGAGSWDTSSDTIPVPSVPSVDITTTGLISLYLPTTAQLLQFGTYIHSKNSAFETWKAMFGNIRECILCLGIIPVTLSASQRVNIVNVIVGNIPTGISMDRAVTQYVTKSMGTINVSKFFNSYLDYSPHTQVEIYLPYIGAKTLDADVVMGKTLGVTYLIDIATGMCVANITVDGTVMFTFSGQCMSLIPLTTSDYSQILQSNINCAVSAITNIAKTVATEGGYAPVGTANIAASVLSNSPGLFKPHIQKTGSTTTTAGALSPQTPYVIITRTKPAIPDDQPYFKGYQSFISDGLYNLNGYTEVEEIHLHGVSATQDELEEIETILKGGFII